MNNDRHVPTNLERDIMVLDMTLSGFKDAEIAEAMGIKAQYCVQLRGRVIGMLLSPKRLDPESETTRSKKQNDLVAYKNIWVERLLALKTEFGLIHEKAIPK